MSSRRLCGIDPGLQVSGYAVIAADDEALTVIDAGVVRTDPTASLAQRLAQLETGIGEILSEHNPVLLAVEELYSHYRHPATAILMGHARGVILLTAARRGLPVLSFSANHIKKALTGNGRASKQQIQRAMLARLRLNRLPEPADVADALAVAVCAAAG
ncbi:MAG: crossover junction endodeoxyribonuclease RuvC, partial [Phycisphaerae bacterium]